MTPSAFPDVWAAGNNAPDVRDALTRYGVAVVGGQDPASFLRLCSELGELDDHDGAGTYVWHVQPGASTGARSHGTGQFQLHTDCSWQTPTPTHVALHVISGDRHGGGATLLADVAGVIGAIPQDQQQLLATDMTIRVPAEFGGAAAAVVRGPVITGPGTCRYRAELIVADDADQAGALDAFATAVADATTYRDNLADGTTLLLDNRRWLHGREAVTDPQRHLLRVRLHQHP